MRGWRAGVLLALAWMVLGYLLLPIVVVFVLFGLLLVFTQSSAVAPFIYSLF